VTNFRRFIKRQRNRFRRYVLLDERNYHQFWESRHLGKLLDLLDVDCVLDIGANEGQYAEMLRQKANYQGLIVSFEPMPDAAARCRARSASDPHWLVQELAISNKDGEQVFNTMASPQFSSLSTPKHDESTFFTENNSITSSAMGKTETLSSALKRIVADHGIKRPFLKMDTQGFDTTIVESSKSIMDQFVGLQSELAIKKIYESSVDFREAITLYQECGFDLCAFVPNNYGHFPLLIEMDCIMIRRDLVPDDSMYTRLKI
jgi:FkbM family methyltransferase